MAALTDGDRIAVWTDIMRQVSDLRATTALTKAQVRVLIDASDDFIDANAAAFNTSIPLPTRTLATAQEKALAFALVALKRYGVT